MFDRYFSTLVREAISFKEQSKYGHCPEGEKGFQPLLKFLSSTILWTFIFGKNGKREGGVKAMPKDLEHFKGFNIVEFN